MKNIHLLIVCYLLFSTILIADIINVPADTSTIQGGISMAFNGDTVLVNNGTYYENINFVGKSITVASHYYIDGDTSHISNTIIDGSNHSDPDSGSVVYFISGEDTTSIICGFTITSGTGTYSPNPFAMRIGGGILCFNSAAKIEYNIIKNNSVEIELADASAMGGGIFCGPPSNSGLYSIIYKNQIWSNNVITSGISSNWDKGWAQGGGIIILYDGLVTENDIYLNHCEAAYGYAVGGGVRIMGGATVYLVNNLLHYNSSISTSSYAFAGGISCSAANTVIDSNEILNNFIAGTPDCRGGAIYFDLDNGINWATVKNNLISNNYHTNGICYGGAIGMFTSNPNIYNNIIINNSADYGGALHIFDNSKPNIINNTISGNFATQEGGAVYAEDSNTHVFLMNSILWNNTSSGAGHEIDINNNSTISTVFCDIQGGWAGEGNIDIDPRFIDSLFHLSDSSRCLGKGIQSYNFSGIVYNAPEYDFEGNIRPNPAGSRPDMGALENERAYPFLTVIQIPEDYETIQAGVDAAEDSDTVLVSEGTYYENIIIQSKAITLASYFLIDEDTSHISKTIINGSQPVNTDNASVIMIFNTSEPNTICGFTLTSGMGSKKVFPDGTYSQGGGGILIEESSAIIKNNHIINNSVLSLPPSRVAFGGGIMWGAGINTGLTLKISGNLISGNKISGIQSGGGGINISNYIIGGELDYLIEKNIIEDNTITNTDEWKAMGGGIFIDFCLPTIGNQTIRNNIIRNNIIYCSLSNAHSFGGGLYFLIRDTEATGTVDNDPGPYVYNNIISGNHSDYLGGGVSVWRAYYIPPDPANPLQSAGNYVPKPSFINNTIVNNTAQDGSGFFIYNHVPILMNNIIWNDYPENAEWGEIFLGDEPYFIDPVNKYGGAEIYYTDIQGGWDKGTGNTKVEPMFTDAENSDFHLLENSPGIGWGVNSVTIDTIQYFAPRFDFDGFQRPNPVDIYFDMGAYESPYAQTEPNSINENYYISKKFTLSQNYPNPFNPRTIINYELPITNYVDLSVFNLLGQNVVTLVNEHQQAGYHQVEWDASGFASGIYYYRIEAGNFTETRKMIYLK